MRVKPPGAEELRRFTPAFVTDDDLSDLASFTGLTPEACKERLLDYSLTELADAWRRADPSAPDELLAFYRSADSYVWELMQWHASSDRRPYFQALNYVVENFPARSGWRRVYDFGAGVGTDALFLAGRGYDITLVDVDGPAFRFARHRFERRGLEANFVESRSPLPEPEGTYDIAVCFDVFEHLPDPLGAARRLAAALRPGGLLVQRATFDGEQDHPCHLEEGLRRFGGPRWGIHLSRLGFKGLTEMVFQKAAGAGRLALRLRYALWLATGLWVVRVGR